MSPLLSERRPSCATDGYEGTGACGVCPWRRDTAVGRFPPERYVALASTSVAGAGPVFACHTSAEEASHACVGWLLADGGRFNFQAQLAKAMGRWDPAALRTRGALYDTYGEMALANGVPPEVVDALGVASPSRPYPIQVIPPAEMPMSDAAHYTDQMVLARVAGVLAQQPEAPTTRTVPMLSAARRTGPAPRRRQR
ncbi:DUF6283 family protein [Catenuloplanes japonicus]|uniref:DUF6283 family protein n=1 Tax=Catenuloplanes japonicus TaxID=33876 RepID=UPI000527D9C6|nr:DUF6283 family protein [Catenuloplanes japonicus]